MHKNISSKAMSDRITKYYLMHRSLLKTLMKVGKMPLAQYHILSLLTKNTSMRMGEISQIMAISRPNLTPLVDKLVSLGYVKRISDDHDRRVTYVSITSEGLEALQNEHDLISKSISKFTDRLNDEDRERLAEALDTFSEIASRV